MKSQHECFRMRDPETPAEDFYKTYKYHYYHEIGLRDHPGVTTTATRDQIIAALFPGSTTELTFTFELTYEFQTPWHRNIKDAFAILNCVNHPEFWLYFLGALFIGVTLFLPNGLVGLVKKLSAKRKGGTP